MKSKLGIWVVLVLLMACSVLGIVEWRAEAGTSARGSTPTVTTGYTLNVPSTASVTGLNYSVCGLPVSNFTAVYSDLNNLGAGEVVIGIGSVISIYSFRCDIIQELTLTGSIRAQPVIGNANGNAYQEIYVLTTSGLEVIEYSTTASQYVVTRTILYPTTEVFDKLACTFINSPNACLALAYNGRNLTYFDLSAYTSTLLSGVLAKSFGDAGMFLDGAGWMSSEETSTTPGVSATQSLPICGLDSSSSNYRLCNVFDQTGYVAFNLTPPSPSVTSSSYTRGTIFKAKLGGTYYYFTNAYAATAGTAAIISSADVDQVALTHGAAGWDSNWAVGDYNKDGQNEACIIDAVNYQVSPYLKCYDGSFALIEDLNLSLCDFPKQKVNIVLGDFQLNETTLGFATIQGIWYSDHAGGCRLWYNSTFTDTGSAYPIAVFPYTTPRSPIVVVAGGVGMTNNFIMYPGLYESCGDGECSSYENTFFCPADCPAANITGADTATGASCEDNADCASGKCEAYVCVLKLSGESCTSDSECLSGDCSNGRCTNPGYVATMTQAKDSMFGSDIDSGNLISLLVIVGAVVAIIIGGKSLAAVLISIPVFFVLTLFFTLIGWMSPLILILAIFGGLVMVVFYFVTGGSSE